MESQWYYFCRRKYDRLRSIRRFYRFVVWLDNDNSPVRTISADLKLPAGIFVTNNGDIYVDNAFSNGRVEKWTSNSTDSVPVMNVSSVCISLFVDVNNTLYCSNNAQNIVIKRSLNNSMSTVAIAAGNGNAGFDAYMLKSPAGLFVDFQLNLYVNDYDNNRIQRFRANELNGTTIVGNRSFETVVLNGPTDVILDSNGYLFITDSRNNRVLRSASTGYLCIIGCTSTSGMMSHQLNHPQALIFDSYGNLFVVDQYNNRIQKFLLMTNSCGKIKFN